MAVATLEYLPHRLFLICCGRHGPKIKVPGFHIYINVLAAFEDVQVVRPSACRVSSKMGEVPLGFVTISQIYT